MLYKQIQLNFGAGTADWIQHGHVISPTIFAVFDGVSTPYSPKNPKKYYGREQLSSGALIVQRTCANIQKTAFGIETRESDVRKIMLQANRAIMDLQQCYDMPLHDPALLPGATFAVAAIGESSVDIMQTGDSYAVWQIKNGSCFITKNQLLEHDVKWGDPIFREIQRKHRKHFSATGNELEVSEEQLVAARTATWDEYYDLWIPKRREDINNPNSPSGFGLLNGQPEAKGCWFQTSVPREEINLLILFTDGLIDYASFKNDGELKEYIIRTYRQNGLRGILSKKRRWEKLHAKSNYVDQTEATAIAIEF